MKSSLRILCKKNNIFLEKNIFFDIVNSYYKRCIKHQFQNEVLDMRNFQEYMQSTLSARALVQKNRNSGDAIDLAQFANAHSLAKGALAHLSGAGDLRAINHAALNPVVDQSIAPALA